MSRWRYQVSTTGCANHQTQDRCISRQSCGVIFASFKSLPGAFICPAMSADRKGLMNIEIARNDRQSGKQD